MALQTFSAYAKLIDGPSCAGAFTAAALSFPYLTGSQGWLPFVAKADGFAQNAPLQVTPVHLHVPNVYTASDLPLKSMRSLLCPKSLGMCLIRNELLTIAIAYQPWVLAVIEAEEAALEGAHEAVYPPMPPFRPVLIRGLYSSAREMCAKALRIHLQHMLAARIVARTAYGYIAELTTQLKHQALLLQGQSVLKRTGVYFRTTLEALAMATLADCLISVLEVSYVVSRAGKRSASAKLRHWSVGVLCQVLRCLVSLGASAGGATAAALLFSAGKAHWGAFATDFVVSTLFINIAMVEIEARLLPVERNGGDAPAPEAELQGDDAPVQPAA